MHIMNKLFNTFETKSINYLHFKSNTNLNFSFEGTGDFDILVDKNRKGEIEDSIKECNGTKYNQTFGNYPGVDNWLVFDSESGNIYHLHLHYNLITGKALLKDYILPWDKLLFETRQKDNKYSIYKTDPNLEIILLTVRSVVKARIKDYVKSLLGSYKLHKSLQGEKKDLLEKIDQNKVKEYIRILFPKSNEEKLLKYILKPNLTSSDFLQLSLIVRKAYASTRRYSILTSNILSAYYQIKKRYNILISKYLAQYRIIKKTNPNGGAIIAFVGADGSGKSTVVKEINKWLSYKIECTKFYMGTGDGKTTILNSIIKKIRHNNNKINHPASEPNSTENKSIKFWIHPIKYIGTLLKMISILDVERNNYHKLQNIQKYKCKGGISILDRYPQIEISGQNDGPKLHKYVSLLNNNFIAKYLEKKELIYLNIVKTIKPDLVIRLFVNPEIAEKRKKDEQINIIDYRQKQTEMNKLTFQDSNIVEIDTNQPYNEEILHLKRIIWKEINKNI